MGAAGLFLLGTALCGSLVLHPPPPYFENAAQDATGDLWAYSRAEYNHIYRFDGAGWTQQDAPFIFHNSAMPAYVVRMTDGAIACVWDIEPHTVAVTRHTSAGCTLLGTCDGHISATGLTLQPLADSQNRLWITTEGRDIYRADAGGVKLIHRFAPEEYTGPVSRPDGYNRIHAVEDARHRVWVWSDPAASNYASLRGVEIFTGDTPQLHTVFGKIEGRRILALAPAGEHAMWMSVADDGIYRVDLDTFGLTREPDPIPKAFCCVHELHTEGGDLFAVEDYPDFKHALWRRHDGDWKLVADPIGAYPFLPRSWLALPQGLLVEGDENAAWFIPPSGPAAQLSWKTGFPLSLAHAFARLANGHIFALGGEDKIFDAPLELPPRAGENARLEWVAAERGWQEDSNGRIWAILKETPQMLSEWDGIRWTGHPLPVPVSPQYQPTVEPDVRGQLWVDAPEKMGGLQIYDPVADRWQTFPDRPAAYLALSSRPPEFMKNGTLDYEGPVYSADRQHVAYREGAAYIYYHDGTKWTHFDRFQITHSNNDNAVGPPAFDAAGRLLVNLREHLSYRMDAPGHWTQLPFHSLYPEDQWSEGGQHPNLSRVTPPEGAVTRQPDFCVQDNVGTWWLTWKGQLYRAAPGLCVPQFGPGEVNPFLSHPGLGKIFVDRNGNALFAFGSETDPFLLLRPRHPPPRTVITLTSLAPDSYTAHLDARTGGDVTFRWQLDEREWRQGPDSDLPLHHLPNGSHTLRVLALTDDLDIQASPTVAAFTTQISPARQLAELVAQLHDPDYDQRKEAVEALALQPGPAIVALQRARGQATGDDQWWIDVALQEAERSVPRGDSSSTKAPGRPTR